MGTGVEFRIRGRNGFSRASIIYSQEAQRPGAELSREARAILRLNNVVGVVQADRCLEIAAVFDKKRPNFREVGRKPLIGDSRIVDPDLAEIGVNRGIENQAVMEDKLRIEPGVALEVDVLKV